MLRRNRTGVFAHGVLGGPAEFDVIICTGCAPSRASFSSQRQSPSHCLRFLVLLFVPFTVNCQMSFQVKDKRKHLFSRGVS